MKNGTLLSNFSDAQIIVVLAGTLSITAAAKQLKMPIATLSRRLKEIEGKAGALLFHRNTRGVKVTNIGQIFLRHATSILDELELLNSNISENTNTISGNVRVTAPVILGQLVLGGLISDFIKHYPNVTFEIILSDEQTDYANKQIDVGFKVGTTEHNTVILKKITQVRTKLYVDIENKLVVTHPSELATHPFALLYAGDSKNTRIKLFNDSIDELELTVNAKIVCMNPWLIKSALENSNLIAVLPDFVSRGKGSERLRPILPDYYARAADLAIAFTHRNNQRPVVRKFIDHAFAYLSQYLESENV
uniref:LysR family transcriptional regulator n=1 Tax=Ningiella ruwaisensis TaxID=2364274 RepID=UPI00109F7259|nr:LysR family transcriptional regulator [Ningiella ruwaisensis]